MFYSRRTWSAGFPSQPDVNRVAQEVVGRPGQKVISATSFGSTQWTRERISRDPKRVFRGGGTFRGAPRVRFIACASHKPPYIGRGGLPIYVQNDDAAPSALGGDAQMHRNRTSVGGVRERGQKQASWCQ